MQIEEGKDHPALEQAGAHGRVCAVEGLQQAASFAVACGQQLQVADGEAIHPEERLCYYAADAGDVLEVGMLCVFEVMQGGTCCDSCGFQIFDAVAFEALSAEVLQEQI